MSAFYTSMRMSAHMSVLHCSLRAVRGAEWISRSRHLHGSLHAAMPRRIIERVSTHVDAPSLVCLEHLAEHMSKYYMSKHMSKHKHMSAHRYALPSLANVGGLLLLLFVVYAILGRNLFFNVRMQVYL